MWKYSYKLINHTKKSTKDGFKFFQKTNLKNSRSDWWFDWYEIANKIK